MKSTIFNGITVHRNRPVDIVYLGADGVGVVDGNGNIIQKFKNLPSPTAIVDDAPHYIAARAMAAYLNAVT